MYLIQKIKNDINTNIANIENLYFEYSKSFENTLSHVIINDNYDLEYKKRIKDINQKIVRSSKTSDKKEELDLLLEIIEDIGYLLALKNEFTDNKDIKQIKIESDIIAIDFGFLYLNYCLNNLNVRDLPESYIDNSLSPLEIIATIFTFRTNGLYYIEIKKIEEMISAFNQLVNNVKVFSDMIAILNYSFETYQKLKFKLSKSLQSIYSCLFILNEIKDQREYNTKAEEKIANLFPNKDTYNFIKRQEQDFLNLDRNQLAKYCDQFVYFENKKIIDSDVDEAALIERVMKKVNHRSVFITKVDCDK